MAKSKVVAGQDYGRLKVVSRTDDKGPARFLCTCRCGSRKVVSSQCLLAGKTKSCGCLFNEVIKTRGLTFAKTYRQKAPGEAAFNQMYSTYRLGAKYRNLAWELSKDIFRRLTALPCHYCGVPPSNIHALRSGNFVYSGLDRVDNGVGYTELNVVPCCQQCNRAKNQCTKEEFLQWLRRAALHSKIYG
jgi:hypothetical protein